MTAPDPGTRADETGAAVEDEPKLRLVTEQSQPFGYATALEETWAVAVLDDGTEIRIRRLGDRVEVRGWDPKAQCRPPALRADVLGRYRHIVDVSAAETDSAAPPTQEPQR